MRKMGLLATYRKPKTSQKAPEHRICPYLLRGLSIEETNHVWCSDITYIPMPRGFAYLTMIMDWATRAVLAWRVSNTLDATPWVEALKAANAHSRRRLSRVGRANPSINARHSQPPQSAQYGFGDSCCNCCREHHKSWPGQSPGGNRVTANHDLGRGRCEPGRRCRYRNDDFILNAFFCLQVGERLPVKALTPSATTRILCRS